MTTQRQVSHFRSVSYLLGLIILEARVISTNNDKYTMQWCAVTGLELDYTHQVIAVLEIRDKTAWSDAHLTMDDVLVNCPIPRLFTLYHMWRAGDLRQLASAHDVGIPSRESAPDMVERLDAHGCHRDCPAVVVVFQTLRRMRGAAQVEAARDRIRNLNLHGTNSYMQVANETLRRSIIREWQQVMTTLNYGTLVCAPCGRRTQTKDTKRVDVRRIDLSLLVNNALPAKVNPTTYNFELYGRALLNPEGMLDRWQHADLITCRVCYWELVDNHRMPRLCLANWLYYGYNELPSPAKDAFRDATPTERLLISRARASRISFRFSELKKKKQETEDAANGDSRPPDSGGNRLATSQRCVKGNVLVVPQNATHLNSVLPPPPEVIRDTVCVVYVGRTKPSKTTIGKLGPALARKTRVRAMVEFLVEHNVHYACDSRFHGLSEENLDSLFSCDDRGRDEAVPCAIDIGFIEETEFVLAAEADYTTRNLDIDDAREDEPLLMDNVGYTLGDDSPVSYRDMKMKALSHCINGGKFIRSQSGDKFIPDFENPSLMTWLFPQLDPWGIGGFHEQSRPIPISMEEQLKYLMEVDDSPFQKDPDFAFVYFNILQKKAVCDSVRFRVAAAQQERIVRELMSIDKGELDRLIARLKANHSYQAESDEEKRILKLVTQVGASLHDIPGTAGYKLKMRNEIRSLVAFRGTPAFFITLNPSDVNHPLVRLLTGDDIQLEAMEQGEELTEWQRRLTVSRNPAACARFFHAIISSFITVVLRYGKKDRGIIGKCTAYYGSVEAQARGTLHCHMLVWIYGHPNPQKMRDMMLNSAQYTQDMFTWLESVIKCELIGTTMLVQENEGEELARPSLGGKDGYKHPSTHLGPRIDDLPEDAFPLQFASSVNDVVQHCNWHKHTETCWKYLRRGEKRNDASCRMRIDGSTRQTSSIDPDTGSILLRRLHPRIANYNDVIIFLLRANMDIKHIGSGEAAKALIYYITDYITKSSLPTHIGLSALLHAIHRASDKYKEKETWERDEYAGALTIMINSILSRQEISHQQVMSYLVGGGDKYTNEKYRIIHFGSFERHVVRYWASKENGGEREQHMSSVEQPAHPAPSTRRDGATDDHVEQTATTAHTDSTTTEQGEVQRLGGVTDITEEFRERIHEPDDQVTLYLKAGSISAINQIHDYMMRPQTEPFESMGLYEYVGMTEKITKSMESRRVNRHSAEQPDARRGRPEESRGHFLPDHPQHDTHMVRKRTVWVIPVVLGDRMPRPDRDEEERLLWARTVLILFHPWRHPSDLKDGEEDWIDAYDRLKHLIPPEHMSIIHNMNVLSECRDARDKANAARTAARLHRRTSQLRTPSPDPFAVFEEQVQQPPMPSTTDHGADQPLDGNDLLVVDRTDQLLDALDKSLGVRFRHALDQCYRALRAGPTSDNYGTAEVVTSQQEDRLKTEHQMMRQAKRKRKREHLPRESNEHRRNTRRRIDRPPRIDTYELTNDDVPTNAEETRATPEPQIRADIIRQVVLENNLLSNKEQLRAFELVAQHVCFGGDQLLMYVGGVGGTGKTHVVNSILRLFSLLGKGDKILVAAPTGAAAILIGGHTIHSLTLLPDAPGKNLQELCDIWEKVDYLVLDKVSMIGASFLSMLNARLQRAKGTNEAFHDLPFGGINIVFTGDFGQLRPVRESALYSHKLVDDPDLAQCRNKSAVGSLMGVYLWRLVTTVVLLKQNQRQSGDRTYADLLGRVRAGECSRQPRSAGESDYNTLQSRYLDRLIANDADAMGQFINAPIIVGRKRVRDLLNLRILDHRAKAMKADVRLYHARDRISGYPVTPAERDILWKLSSSTTHDSLGRLPLFPGMRVMVQENLAFTNRVVNGSEGTVQNILYEEVDGRRYAVVVYVHIPGSGRVHPYAENDVVPIFPETSSFNWLRRTATGIQQHTVSRVQLPLLPAYAYTDYKSQGRSLDAAVVDPSSAFSLQGVYVMLFRVRSMTGLAILCPFPENKLTQRLSQELRNELTRLERLAEETERAHYRNADRVV